MNYFIENEKLKITISDLGAELQSIYGKKTNFEYLWQGNPEFWSGRAYNLFPICGRLTDGKYSYKGIEYQMGIHGIAKKMVFHVIEQEDDCIIFELKSSKETLSVYPFEFVLKIKYCLDCNKLKHEFIIENNGLDSLFFSFGVHYGFNVPLCDNALFNEHYIDFFAKQNLFNSVGSINGLSTNKQQKYPLVEGRYLRLNHKLFDNRSIFLSKMGNIVAIKCDKTKRFIKMQYQDITHLVLWHTLKTEAPFICVEPWHGKPSFDGIVDDFETKKEMIKLQPKKNYNSVIELTFNEV